MARILLIDDEKNIRLMVRTALVHVGHEVDTAADGPEGLEKFGRGQSWDLVLLDHRMPGMEGLGMGMPGMMPGMMPGFGGVDPAKPSMTKMRQLSKSEKNARKSQRKRERDARKKGRK